MAENNTRMPYTEGDLLNYLFSSGYFGGIYGLQQRNANAESVFL
jgi:hypothetical protein